MREAIIMAKLKNEIIGSVRGRLGDLVFYESNGETCIRTLPANFKDRESEKQLLQREKLKTIGKLYTVFHPALRFEITKKHTSQSSLFSKENWKNILVTNDTVSVDYERLILSNQLDIKILNLKVNRNGNQVFFEWDADDLLGNSFYILCAVYCSGIKQVYVTDVPRNSLSAKIILPTNAGEIITYAYTHRK